MKKTAITIINMFKVFLDLVIKLLSSTNNTQNKEVTTNTTNISYSNLCYRDIQDAIKDPAKLNTLLSRKVSKYFTLREVLQYDSGRRIAPLTQITLGVLANLQRLCSAMDSVREFYGRPIIVNSCFRTPEWNKQLDGSATNSQHLLGKAMDVKVQGITPQKVQQDFNSKWQGGLGSYKDFTHFDIRGTKARWKG